jgi:hypothetical protein
MARRQRPGFIHLVIGLADHFEPAIVPTDGRARAPYEAQERRLERWCQQYPKVVREWLDADGCPFRHTYFYPAEQYDRGLIDTLAYHCKAGWGEIEVHLHHGCERPDTPANTRRQLLEFRDTLVRHGCLAQLDDQGQPRYAFVHGSFALANSIGGACCGVDSEMQILAETGCYADLTLPSAPHITQTAKINSLYECALPLEQRAPHRRGRDLECGRAPQIFPLIIQGPLMLNFARGRRHGIFPRIENAELTTVNPPTMERLALWVQAGIAVRGRPDWRFIKLHCHGMDPRDDEAMLGALMKLFLRDLVEGSADGKYKVHFVTAREMANIVLAACDGREGNPGDYRNYRLRVISRQAHEALHRTGATAPQSSFTPQAAQRDHLGK